MAQWISKAWFFTLNAPKGSSRDEALGFLQPLIEVIKSISHDSLAMQIECGENGTFHIQGVIELKHKTRMKELKSLIHPTVHLEKCKDLVAAKRYCTKEETSVGDRVIHDEDWESWLPKEPNYCPNGWCVQCMGPVTWGLKGKWTPSKIKDEVEEESSTYEDNRPIHGEREDNIL